MCSAFSVSKSQIEPDRGSMVSQESPPRKKLALQGWFLALLTAHEPVTTGGLSKGGCSDEDNTAMLQAMPIFSKSC